MPESLEVQKPAESQLKPSAAPLHERSAAEDWNEFSGRVKTQSVEGATHRSDGAAMRAPERKDTDLKKLTPEQLEHWNKTGEGPEPKEKQESSGVKGDAKPKDGEVNEEDDIRPDERIWTTNFEGEDLKKFGRRLEGQAQRASLHIQKHERRQEIEAGLRNIFAGRDAQHGDFMSALAEVKNPGEVLAHLGLQKQDRDTLLGLPNWQALRKAVHQISRFVMPKPEPPRPRAPRPPSEVGGRGAPHGDDESDALRRNDYATLEKIWNKRVSSTGKR